MLHEFHGDIIPQYAILSHRWEGEEATFQELQDGKGRREIARYSKIQRCSSLAAQDGLEFVWIDSCCIDKSSSAELSEAINSMFKWYQNSAVCYAYLSDVPAVDDHALREEGGDAEAAYTPAFRRSKWFTRGWTLQELLAPQVVVFLYQDWSIIGTKSRVAQSRLGDLISSITGIEDLARFERVSVAAKMSWAAKRETTRVENKAYCLMGLFGASMPPLYGEGENAFLRLQLEILRISDDESIFAWTDNRGGFQGLLAPSPAAFESCGDIKQGGQFPREIQSLRDRPPYSMTNKGLCIELHLIPLIDERKNNVKGLFVAPLNCVR